MLVSFTLGFACGIAATAGGWLLRERFQATLKSDGNYLLAAAQAARGRLILRREVSPLGERLLLLKEFPNPRRIEDGGQIEHLVARRLLAPDPSGVPDRFVLTPRGQKFCRRLPEFPLQAVRQGSWFNSISRPMRAVRR